jgi:hypothetical protein
MPLTKAADDRVASRALSVQWRVRPRELSQAINGVYHRYCTELVERDIADSLQNGRATPLAWFGFQCVGRREQQEALSIMCTALGKWPHK